MSEESTLMQEAPVGATVEEGTTGESWTYAPTGSHLPRPTIHRRVHPDRLRLQHFRP